MLSHYVGSYFRLFFATWTCLKREEARKPIKFDGSHWLFPMVGCFFSTRKPHRGPFFLKHRQIEAGFSTISENPISMFEKFQWFFNGRSSELFWYLFSIFQNKKGELVGDRNSNIIGCQISESNIWWSHVYIYGYMIYGYIYRERVSQYLCFILQPLVDPIPWGFTMATEGCEPTASAGDAARCPYLGESWGSAEPFKKTLVDWLPSGKLTFN